MEKKVEIFFCYAHEDEPLLKKLQTRCYLECCVKRNVPKGEH